MDTIFYLQNDTLVATLSGEIDHHVADGIRKDIDDEMQLYEVKNLVFDFSDVTFMDSSGIAVVLRAKRRMEALAGALVVVNIPRQAARVLETAGLSRYIDLV